MAGEVYEIPSDFDFRKVDKYNVCKTLTDLTGGIDPDLLGPATPALINPTSNQLEDKMISRIKDMGRVQERLKIILDDEIFETLSKHNTYWHSKHEPEADKLDDLRRKFSYFNDNLWDIMGILRTEEES